jgi:hypothetical protein
MPVDEMLKRRYDRFRNMGPYLEGAVEAAAAT